MIDHLTPILSHAVSQGLIFSLVVMAIYLTSRVISFDDLTVEGSFGIGGAAVAMVSLHGGDAYALLGLVCAWIAGVCAGLATAFCHNKLQMNNLISGLVVTTGLFSISLWFAGSNVSVAPSSLASMGSLVAVCGVALAAMHMLLRSEIGYLLLALGANPSMLTTLGKSIDRYKTLALIVGNGLTALAGGLFVLFAGYYSALGNIGTMVIGLAGLMIAEAFSKSLGVFLIVGAVAYQLIFAMVLELQMPPTWNNLLKALLVIALIVLRRVK